LFPSANQTDPVIIWLGDGPACSALYDAVNNIGLYRIDPSGMLLYENPYSWDHVSDS
uniref:Serine/threonine protein kinase n=1 Tax=Gongylonema pulchrum TaxID=637853 RepID=A0A183F0D3_9BILA